MNRTNSLWFYTLFLSSIMIITPVSVICFSSNIESRTCFTVEVVGNSINFDRENVLSEYVTGIITFDSSQNGFVDVSAIFYDDETAYVTQSEHISVIWEVTSTPNLGQILTMDLDDYTVGTFIVMVHMATAARNPR